MQKPSWTSWTNMTLAQVLSLGMLKTRNT
jgi:hypothetical protein